MNELYLTHPYDWMAHYGIPGMKWGKRRFQNKDGSLTPAGQKRYAKIARKHIRKSKGDPKAFLKEGVSETFGPGERVKMKAAYNKMVDLIGDANNAKTRLDALTEAKADTRYHEEVAKNPDVYQGFMTGSARKELRNRVAAEAAKATRSDNPDLVRRIEDGKLSVRTWNNMCREATDTLVGKYGNKKVRMFSKETVGETLSNMLSRVALDEWYD